MKMPPRIKNIIGKTINNWLVLEYAGRQRSSYYIKGRCVCGAEKAVQVGDLLCGRSKSCGCHGLLLEDRFLEKVNKADGCWLWTGSKNPNGYGQIRVDKKSILTHRVSWELYKGPIPKGLFVCHHCDTPACVNPNHLFLGTQSDNIQDMLAKGRSGNAKLTVDQTREIRERVANGEKPIMIAKEFGVVKSTIYRVVNRKTWKEI